MLKAVALKTTTNQDTSLYLYYYCIIIIIISIIIIIIIILFILFKLFLAPLIFVSLTLMAMIFFYWRSHWTRQEAMVFKVLAARLWLESGGITSM